MKRRMRNRTYGAVGGDGLYPVTYPIIRQSSLKTITKINNFKFPIAEKSVMLVSSDTVASLSGQFLFFIE